MAKHTKQTNKMLKVLSITIGSIIVVTAGLFLAINLTSPGKTPTESFHTTQSSTKSSSTTKESKTEESSTEESKPADSSSKESTKMQGNVNTPVYITIPDYTKQEMTITEFQDEVYRLNPNTNPMFGLKDVTPEPSNGTVEQNRYVVVNSNAKPGTPFDVANHTIYYDVKLKGWNESSSSTPNAGRDYAKEPVHGTFANIRETSTYIVWGTPEGIYYVEPKTTNGLKGMTVHEMEQLTFSMGVKDVGNIDPSKVNDIVTGLSVDITQTFKPSAGPVYIYTDNTPAKYTLK
ncbi:hypothetical protein P7H71_13295 [Lactococcus lactis]|uniref:hypothetical protein n=1 Tax=Lactococcus lactis TaxID=1358 RepID=UPI0025A2E577|nr:hypothetical protein [Lactococcus lactis]MDT2868957.1 hypothetical protein [Lactococcus lactis]MDT2901476.1 hypothetical protein [Lactococcus lactis]MDU2186438.1 hypothetical protein [Lactococcus lactis]